MTPIPERLTAALVDRYRIERAIGADGMATVYLAYDVKHDRRVALKVLKPELAAVLGADRFVATASFTATSSRRTSCCMKSALWWWTSALHSQCLRRRAAA